MSRENRSLQGIPASPGIVIGRVQVLTEAAQVSTRHLYTQEDVDEEQERFRQAVDQIESELTVLKEGISEDLKEHAHILELHLLILRDRMLNSETLRLIQEENLNAERALHQAYLKINELFQRIG
ncbi:MAG: phosphoenolpyruvate-utilizing N-terminal domain-containing protein, partial [Desulfobaccales bacterium]